MKCSLLERFKQQPKGTTKRQQKEMGGGNAQKTAMSRQRNQAKMEGAKNAGGGKSAMEGLFENSTLKTIPFNIDSYFFFTQLERVVI